MLFNFEKEALTGLQAISLLSAGGIDAQVVATHASSLNAAPLTIQTLFRILFTALHTVETPSIQTTLRMLYDALRSIGPVIIETIRQKLAV